jgi:hypothetical protein
MGRLNLLGQNDFCVAKIITFEDFHNKCGSIVYFRKYPVENGDFDNSMIEWIKHLNFKNVNLISKDIFFENEKDSLKQSYTDGCDSEDFIIRCHGNYELKEIEKKGYVECCDIKLKIYWQNVPNNFKAKGFLHIDCFDKSKEKDYFNIIENISSL